MVTEWKQLCLSKVIKSEMPINVRKIMQEMLKALQSIHSSYMMHRDIKPANIVLDDAELLNLKIIDFGMSKEVKWLVGNNDHILHFQKLMQGPDKL